MRKFKEMKENNKGFSLVELIIVIAIMAVLVGVLAPQFIKYVESSKQSTDIQNAAELRAAIEAYVAENAPASDIVVAVGTNQITVSGVTGIGDALEEVGLSATIATKSTGWPTNTALATYSHTTFKWTTTAEQNNNKPEKHLEDAFK